MNPADLDWPEDPGYRKVPPPGDDPERAYVQAQAVLALTGARRNRYGTLPGRDPELCETLNAETAQAQADCDAAREALIAAPKAEPFGPPLVE